jgi:hypothetical protein
MYTPHCRAGLVLSLSLSRDAQGNVDWMRPEVQLVYNARLKLLPGFRRLMRIEDFLQLRRNLGKRAMKVGALRDWLQRHLLGEDRY